MNNAIYKEKTTLNVVFSLARGLGNSNARSAAHDMAVGPLVFALLSHPAAGKPLFPRPPSSSIQVESDAKTPREVVLLLGSPPRSRTFGMSHFYFTIKRNETFETV